MSKGRKLAAWGAVAAAVLTLLVVGISWAAGPNGPLGRRARLLQLMRELNVNPTQARELRSAAIHLRVERNALDMEELSPSERKERLFELRREFFAQAQSVLTPEQRRKLTQKFEAWRTGNAGKFRAAAVRAADRLNLSDEQRTSAKKILSDLKADIRQEKQDKTQDVPSRLARSIEALEDTRARLYRILTPTQQAAAKKMLEKAIDRRLPKDILAPAASE